VSVPFESVSAAVSVVPCEFELLELVPELEVEVELESLPAWAEPIKAEAMASPERRFAALLWFPLASGEQDSMNFDSSRSKPLNRKYVRLRGRRLINRLHPLQSCQLIAWCGVANATTPRPVRVRGRRNFPD
jgi:hypothetical protein